MMVARRTRGLKGAALAVGNTHEVAQWVAPESRIVYVDNDPDFTLVTGCQDPF
jgi:S-adenosyl methyltransferase